MYHVWEVPSCFGTKAMYSTVNKERCSVHVMRQTLSCSQNHRNHKAYRTGEEITRYKVVAILWYTIRIPTGYRIHEMTKLIHYAYPNLTTPVKSEGTLSPIASLWGYQYLVRWYQTDNCRRIRDMYCWASTWHVSEGLKLSHALLGYQLPH